MASCKSVSLTLANARWYFSDWLLYCLLDYHRKRDRYSVYLITSTFYSTLGVTRVDHLMRSQRSTTVPKWNCAFVWPLALVLISPVVYIIEVWSYQLTTIESDGGYTRKGAPFAYCEVVMLHARQSDTIVRTCIVVDIQAISDWV